MTGARILLAGWFSYERHGATAGDLLAKDVACRWLTEAGREYDVALAAPFTGGVSLDAVDPADYSEVLFVCGPARRRPPLTELISRFSHCRWVGLNLSLFEPLEKWNPFHTLFERDSSRARRPDLTFLSHGPRVPVAGLILVDETFGYERPMEDTARQAILRLLDRWEMAVVRIDTRLDTNGTGLRSAAEVESLIARMDVVLTTRLHGMVLALKNGVPALAVDPIGGGGKVWPQADRLGWTPVFTADAVTDEGLEQALQYCLTEEARRAARSCAESAKEQLRATRLEFRDAFRLPEPSDVSGAT